MTTQINKIYYHIAEDDSRYFRTIRMHRNPMNGRITPQVSNLIMGVPPEGLEPIPPLMKQRLFSMSNALPYNL